MKASVPYEIHDDFPERIEGVLDEETEILAPGLLNRILARLKEDDGQADKDAGGPIREGQHG